MTPTVGGAEFPVLALRRSCAPLMPYPEAVGSATLTGVRPGAFITDHGVAWRGLCPATPPRGTGGGWQTRSAKARFRQGTTLRPWEPPAGSCQRAPGRLVRKFGASQRKRACPGRYALARAHWRPDVLTYPTHPRTLRPQDSPAPRHAPGPLRASHERVRPRAGPSN
jgi:hypothetical protein